MANSLDGLDLKPVELRNAPVVSETPEPRSGRTTHHDGIQAGRRSSGLDLSGRFGVYFAQHSNTCLTPKAVLFMISWSVRK